MFKLYGDGRGTYPRIVIFHSFSANGSFELNLTIHRYLVLVLRDVFLLNVEWRYGKDPL